MKVLRTYLLNRILSIFQNIPGIRSFRNELGQVHTYMTQVQAITVARWKLCGRLKFSQQAEGAHNKHEAKSHSLIFSLTKYFPHSRHSSVERTASVNSTPRLSK